MGSTDKRCLDVKATVPSGGGGGGGSDEVQIWAKPQPGGAVAVLVINVGDVNNATVPFTMAEVKYTHTTGATTVLDIWTGKTSTESAVTTYTTDSIAPHDSRFFLFSPSA